MHDADDDDDDDDDDDTGNCVVLIEFFLSSKATIEACADCNSDLAIVWLYFKSNCYLI